MDLITYIAIGLGVILVASLIFAAVPAKEKRMTLKKWNKIRNERDKHVFTENECFDIISGLVEQAAPVQFYSVGGKKAGNPSFNTSKIVTKLAKKYSFLKFEIIGEGGREMIKWTIKEVEENSNESK